MKELKIVGIDLAKTSFHLYGINLLGQRVFSKNLSRAKVTDFVGKLPSCTVAMEACSGAHYWARQFEGMGHEVRLIAPQYVKPFVKRQKNDVRDAQAIAEACSRKHMRFVPIKKIYHQDIQCIHRIRRRIIESRTGLGNEIRGFLAEYGIVVPKGVAQLRKGLPILLENKQEKLSHRIVIELSILYEELLTSDKKVREYDRKINDIVKQNMTCQKLQKIRGVGPLIASAVVSAVPQPDHFKNGREFSAWLGLVPRQSSTGGKTILSGISKQGDRYLRTLLIHGARASMVSVVNADNRTQWALKLKEKKGINKAAVALANKNARVLWAFMANKSPFQAA